MINPILKIKHWWNWTRKVPYGYTCTNESSYGQLEKWYCQFYKKINQYTYYCKYLNKKSSRSLDWKICTKHKMRFIESLEYYFCLLPKNKWQDLIFNIKQFIQRGKRGWAFSDVWDFDNYLSKVIVEGLTYLKENHYGYPLDLTSNKWIKVLDKIIYSFEILKEIHYFVPPVRGRYYTTEELKNLKLLQRKINRNKPKDDRKYILTKKQYKKYREGWKLFEEYFLNLWD